VRPPNREGDGAVRIEDYCLIGDLQAAALVGLPWFDFGSRFQAKDSA
jgi:hypothetical protein